MKAKVLAIGGHKFISDIGSILPTLGIDVKKKSSPKDIKEKCRRGGIGVVVIDDDSCRAKGEKICSGIAGIIRESKKKFVVISSRASLSAIIEARRFGASDYLVKPYNYRELLLHLNSEIYDRMEIACLGGGTGLFNILLGLKTLPETLLTSIVNMSDDGGSSGRLRVSFGILPPGDVRRSLVALSNAPEIMNQVMRYRFQAGQSLSGHNFGNLFLTVLSQIKGSLPEAVRTLGDILNIHGIVLPVTDMSTTLCARFEDGTIVKGESNIDLCKGRRSSLRIQELWHKPDVKCNISAFSSIMNSDIVTIGPGDLFTSVVTNLMAKGINRALSETAAKKIYICNLMTKPGETTRYAAFDHISEIIKYMGGDYLDYIILSNSRVSKKAVDKYAKKHQYPVKIQDIERLASLTKAKIITADVGHEKELVRHDSEKLAKVIQNILHYESKS